LTSRWLRALNHLDNRFEHIGSWSLSDHPADLSPSKLFGIEFSTSWFTVFGPSSLTALGVWNLTSGNGGVTNWWEGSNRDVGGCPLMTDILSIAE
jgi:hypothetical protein